MIFPKWAPKELTDERAEQVSELLRICIEHRVLPNSATEKDALDYAAPSDIDLLDKLLTAPDMESVWGTLSRHSISPLEFYHAVNLGCIGPTSKARRELAPKQYDAWISEVAATAKKLAQLIHKSDFDDLLSRKHLETFKEAQMQTIITFSTSAFSGEKDREKAAIPLKEKYRQLSEGWKLFEPGKLSSVLRELTEKSEDDASVVGFFTEKDQHLQMRPNSEKSSRKWFINELSSFFRSQAGTPLREVVVTMVNVVFGDTIDSKAVRDAEQGVTKIEN